MMKKKNLKALAELSSLAIKNMGGVIHCDSGEYLAYSPVQVVCTEKMSETFDGYLLENKAKFVGEVPAIIGDFNARETIHRYELENSMVRVSLEDLEDKIKSTKKMFKCRRKSYTGDTPFMGSTLGRIFLNNALTEVYYMENQTVCFNTEILYDVCKIICHTEAKIYFSGRTKPIYIVGRYGTGMILPVNNNAENIEMMMEKYGFMRVFEKEN